MERFAGLVFLVLVSAGGLKVGSGGRRSGPGGGLDGRAPLRNTHRNGALSEVQYPRRGDRGKDARDVNREPDEQPFPASTEHQSGGTVNMNPQGAKFDAERPGHDMNGDWDQEPLGSPGGMSRVNDHSDKHLSPGSVARDQHPESPADARGSSWRRENERARNDLRAAADSAAPGRRRRTTDGSPAETRHREPGTRFRRPASDLRWTSPEARLVENKDPISALLRELGAKESRWRRGASHLEREEEEDISVTNSGSNSHFRVGREERGPGPADQDAVNQRRRRHAPHTSTARRAQPRAVKKRQDSAARTGSSGKTEPDLLALLFKNVQSGMNNAGEINPKTADTARTAPQRSDRVRLMHQAVFFADIGEPGHFDHQLGIPNAKHKLLQTQRVNVKSFRAKSSDTSRTQVATAQDTGNLYAESTGSVSGSASVGIVDTDGGKQYWPRVKLGREHTQTDPDQKKKTRLRSESEHDAGDRRGALPNANSPGSQTGAKLGRPGGAAGAASPPPPPPQHNRQPSQYADGKTMRNEPQNWVDPLKRNADGAPSGIKSNCAQGERQYKNTALQYDPNWAPPPPPTSDAATRKPRETPAPDLFFPREKRRHENVMRTKGSGSGSPGDEAAVRGAVRRSAREAGAALGPPRTRRREPGSRSGSGQPVHGPAAAEENPASDPDAAECGDAVPGPTGRGRGKPGQPFSTASEQPGHRGRADVVASVQSLQWRGQEVQGPAGLDSPPAAPAAAGHAAVSPGSAVMARVASGHGTKGNWAALRVKPQRDLDHSNYGRRAQSRGASSPERAGRRNIMHTRSEKQKRAYSQRKLRGRKTHSMALSRTALKRDGKTGNEMARYVQTHGAGADDTDNTFPTGDLRYFVDFMSDQSFRHPQDKTHSKTTQNRNYRLQGGRKIRFLQPIQGPNGPALSTSGGNVVRMRLGLRRIFPPTAHSEAASRSARTVSLAGNPRQNGLEFSAQFRPSAAEYLIEGGRLPPSRDHLTHSFDKNNIGDALKKPRLPDAAPASVPRAAAQIVARSPAQFAREARVSDGLVLTEGDLNEPPQLTVSERGFSAQRKTRTVGEKPRSKESVRGRQQLQLKETHPASKSSSSQDENLTNFQSRILLSTRTIEADSFSNQIPDNEPSAKLHQWESEATSVSGPNRGGNGAGLGELRSIGRVRPDLNGQNPPQSRGHLDADSKLNFAGKGSRMRNTSQLKKSGARAVKRTYAHKEAIRRLDQSNFGSDNREATSSVAGKEANSGRFGRSRLTDISAPSGPDEEPGRALDDAPTDPNSRVVQGGGEGSASAERRAVGAPTSAAAAMRIDPVIPAEPRRSDPVASHHFLDTNDYGAVPGPGEATRERAAFPRLRHSQSAPIAPSTRRAAERLGASPGEVRTDPHVSGAERGVVFRVTGDDVDAAPPRASGPAGKTPSRGAAGSSTHLPQQFGQEMKTKHSPLEALAPGLALFPGGSGTRRSADDYKPQRLKRDVRYAAAPSSMTHKAESMSDESRDRDPGNPFHRSTVSEPGPETNTKSAASKRAAAREGGRQRGALSEEQINPRLLSEPRAADDANQAPFVPDETQHYLGHSQSDHVKSVTVRHLRSRIFGSAPKLDQSERNSKSGLFRRKWGKYPTVPGKFVGQSIDDSSKHRGIESARKLGEEHSRRGPVNGQRESWPRSSSRAQRNTTEDLSPRKMQSLSHSNEKSSLFPGPQRRSEVIASNRRRKLNPRRRSTDPPSRWRGNPDGDPGLRKTRESSRATAHSFEGSGVVVGGSAGTRKQLHGESIRYGSDGWRGVADTDGAGTHVGLYPTERRAHRNGPAHLGADDTADPPPFTADTGREAGPGVRAQLRDRHHHIKSVDFRGSLISDWTDHSGGGKPELSSTGASSHSDLARKDFEGTSTDLSLGYDDDLQWKELNEPVRQRPSKEHFRDWNIQNGSHGSHRKKKAHLRRRRAKNHISSRFVSQVKSAVRKRPRTVRFRPAGASRDPDWAATILQTAALRPSGRSQRSITGNGPNAAVSVGGNGSYARGSDQTSDQLSDKAAAGVSQQSEAEPGEGLEDPALRYRSSAFVEDRPGRPRHPAPGAAPETHRQHNNTDRGDKQDQRHRKSFKNRNSWKNKLGPEERRGNKFLDTDSESLPITEELISTSPGPNQPAIKSGGNAAPDPGRRSRVSKEHQNSGHSAGESRGKATRAPTGSSKPETDRKRTPEVNVDWNLEEGESLTPDSPAEEGYPRRQGNPMSETVTDGLHPYSAGNDKWRRLFLFRVNEFVLIGRVIAPIPVCSQCGFVLQHLGTSV